MGSTACAKPWAPLAAALTALLLVPATAGCGLALDTGSEGGHAVTTTDKASQDGDELVVLDLRSRPSREVLGIEPGDTASIHEQSVGSLGIPTRVLLPDDPEVVLTAFTVRSDTLGAGDQALADPATAPPSRTVVDVHYPSVAQARQEVSGERPGAGARPGRRGALQLAGKQRAGCLGLPAPSGARSCRPSWRRLLRGRHRPTRRRLRSPSRTLGSRRRRRSRRPSSSRASCLHSRARTSSASHLHDGTLVGLGT